MTLAIGAPLAVLAAFAIPVCATSRRPQRLLPIGVLALGAIAALGAPELRAAHGFLLEPLRGWGVHALLVLVAAGGAIRTLTGTSWGLVAAGATLALLGGHAVVILGAIVCADLAVAVGAVRSRPRTLHARVPARVGALVLLASDALLLGAFLQGSDRAIEPLSIGAGAHLIAAIAVRIAGAVAIDDAPPAVGALVVLPLLAPLGWLPPGQPALAAVLAVGAAFAAWRWLRNGARTHATLAATLLALVPVAIGTPGTLILTPVLLTLVVAIAILPDLFRGGALIAVALTGTFALAGADVILATLAATHEPLLRLAGIAAVVALGSLALGALGPARVTPDRDRSAPVRLLVGIVTGGLFALVAVWPARVARAVAPAIADARLPEAGVLGTELRVELAIPIALAAIAVLALLLERIAPERFGVGPAAAEPFVPVVPATVIPPATPWMLAAMLLAGLDAVLLLLVLARSVMHGWL